MHVLNIHRRILPRAKSEVVKLFSTLASAEDHIWPLEKWPAIRFKNGLQAGSQGGHGPIRYQITHYDPTSILVCTFQKPAGFTGTHTFEVTAIDADRSEIRHTIDMQTNLQAALIWSLAIRWLHDALLEDAFDKVENKLTHSAKRTEWSLWVRFLRTILR